MKPLPWEAVCDEVPLLTQYVERRLNAHEHHVIATVKPDGSPRVSGTNVMITDGIMWCGAMPGALRVQDLAIKPTCAIHSAPLHEKLPEGEGDVRINAVARKLSLFEAKYVFKEKFDGTTDMMPGTYFELLIRNFSIVEVHGDEMVITHWSPSSGIDITRHQ